MLVALPPLGEVEGMKAILLAIFGLGAYVVAYRFYAKFLAEKVGWRCADLLRPASIRRKSRSEDDGDGWPGREAAPGLGSLQPLERLPILETARAVELLRQHQVPVGGLVLNRLLPESAHEHPFLAARKEQEDRYLQQIEDRFAELPHLRLPLLPCDVTSNQGLDRVGASHRPSDEGGTTID